jgi:hypothetical protein
VTVLEDVAHPPPPHDQASASLEAGTSSGAGLSTFAGHYHDDVPDLGLDTTANIIEELGLSRLDDDAPFAPTQPTPP